MKRLMLVDDERHIVDWLYELLDLEPELDLEIHKAYSASEALECLSRMKIDVVITDIQMPGMNGLVLLEKIHNSWPYCKVIMLTGHRQFAYIYAAEKYPGTLYLMKTEDDDAILDAVRAQLKAADDEMRRKEVSDASERKSRLLAQNLCLSEWARTGVPPLDQEVMGQNSISLSANRPARLIAAYGRNLRAGMHEQLYFLICKYMEHLYDIAQWSHSGKMVLFMLQKKQTGPVNHADEIRRIVQVLEDVTVALSTESDPVLSFLLDDSETPIEQARSRVHPLQQMILELDDNFSVITTVSAISKEDAAKNSHRLVNQIKKHIDTHLNGDLSLTAISEHVRYNTSYISRVFRQEENIKLSEYIMLARIREAKRILATSRYAVNDVARMVGFDTPQYFATVFRRSVGVSPIQFRTDSENKSIY